MKMTPNKYDSNVGLVFPNFREFVAYWLMDPDGIMQVYYLLNAVCSLQEFTVLLSIENPPGSKVWPRGHWRDS